MNNLEKMRQELITHRVKIIKLAKEFVESSAKNRMQLQYSSRCSTEEYCQQAEELYKLLYKKKGL